MISNMSNRQRTLIAAAIIGALLLVLYILSTAPSRPSQPLSITIAEAHQPVFALLYIAKEKGFFAEQNLNVTYRTFTSGRDALEDVLAGKADLATVYETPVVLHGAQGKDIKILSTLHKSTNNTGLLARKDAGISQASDLVGKRIGVPFNTNAQFFLSLYLQSQGIEISDVKLLDIQPQHLEASLLSGQIDAVSIWNPYLQKINSRFEQEQLLHFRSDVYTEMSVMAAMSKTTEVKQQAITRLYAALVKAEQFLQNSPQQALNLVLQQFNEQQQASIKDIWGGIEPTLALDYVLLNVLRGEAQWLFNQKVVSTLKLNFEKLFHPEFLLKVKPYGVTVSH